MYGSHVSQILQEVELYVRRLCLYFWVSLFVCFDMGLHLILNLNCGSVQKMTLPYVNCMGASILCWYTCLYLTHNCYPHSNHLTTLI